MMMDYIKPVMMALPKKDVYSDIIIISGIINTIWKIDFAFCYQIVCPEPQPTLMFRH